MDPLQAIFNRVSKEGKDKKKYIFLKNESEIAFLYASGFVDAKKFGYKTWIDSFESSKQPDGSYQVSYEKWMEKSKYHYNGPISPPWDPMTVEERVYTEKEIYDLLVNKILPCTIFDSSYAQVYINNLKAQGRLAGGKGMIDKPAKEYILQVINQYPAPMRILEISVYGLMRAKKGSRKAGQEQLQKSKFAAGKTAQQIFSSRLSDLAKTQSKKEVVTPPSGEAKPAISLKDLQKRKVTPGRI